MNKTRIKMDNDEQKSLCRACLKSYASVEMISLFGEYQDIKISDYIYQWVKIDLSMDDGLPTNSCPKCYEAIKITLQLMNRFIESDSKLRNMKDIGRTIKEDCLEETFDDNLDPSIKVEPYFMEFVEAVHGQVEKVPDNNSEQDETEDKNVEQEEFEDNEEMDDNDAPNYDSDDDAEYYEEDDDGDDLEAESEPDEKPKTRSRKPRSPTKDSTRTRSPRKNSTRTAVKPIISKDIKRCCGCKKEISTEEELAKHSIDYHVPLKIEINEEKSEKKPHECDICFKRYTSKKTLQRHQREKYIERPFRCGTCDDSFICEEHLLDHEKTHEGKLEFSFESKKAIPRCCSCLIDFDSFELLNEHSVMVHFPERTEFNENQPLECNVCYKRYKNKNSLSEHRQKAFREKKFQCSQCGRTFRDSSMLNDHERMHTGEKPFKCPICKKNFSIKDSFRKHVKSHNLPKDNFRCEICGKGFRTKGNLKGHYLVHQEERPLTCTLCPSTFSRQICLKLHMRTHTGEKPHCCTMCDKRYAHSSDLRRHIMTHTGIKPYLCTFCGRRFPRKDYLRKHQATHAKETVMRHPVVEAPENAILIPY